MAESKDVKLADLLPCPYNRDVDQAKIAAIKSAIETSGEIKPLVVTEVSTDQGKRLMITDGHHRYLALKELGIADVPVVMADEKGIATATHMKTEQIGKALEHVQRALAKVQEVFADELTKGGPGSGRYPAGSGKDKEEGSKMSFEQTADGRWMALAGGTQWGRGPRDASGASGETFASKEDAIRAVREREDSGKGKDEGGGAKELGDFRQSYIDSLTQRSTKDPSYAGQTYTPEQVERTVDNMLSALARGSAGSFSTNQAMRAAAKKLGIKTTAELSAWVKERYDTQDEDDNKSVMGGDLTKYIKHEGDTWTVYSESGKPMGSYDSEDGAKKRLGQIEYFKHTKKVALGELQKVLILLKAVISEDVIGLETVREDIEGGKPKKETDGKS